MLVSQNQARPRAAPGSAGLDRLGLAPQVIENPSSDLRILGARRGEHVIPRQVGTGSWHQRGKPCNEVLGLEDHVHRAVPIATPFTRHRPAGPPTSAVGLTS